MMEAAAAIAVSFGSLLVLMLIVAGFALLVLAFFFGPFLMMHLGWLLAERKHQQENDAPATRASR
ncbi:hypothetical protein [Ornithinimicrobium murale]|uniref:hypothetical protein n=1 Tax=Ornithinimicrobium murale TaxID=1050153 RepID=UPI0013B422D3|nr:hypothetical protein [Ornithinimicrobium murale]